MTLSHISESSLPCSIEIGGEGPCQCWDIYNGLVRKKSSFPRVFALYERQSGSSWATLSHFGESLPCSIEIGGEGPCPKT